MTNIVKQNSRTMAALVGALMAASLAGGCAHNCPMPENNRRHVSEAAEASAHAAATSQLDEAEASHAWNKDKETAFDLKLTQLPPNKAFQLSLRLANLINTQKVKVDRGTQAPDGPPCTCSCNAGSHSTTATGKIARPVVQPVGTAAPESPVASPLTPASAAAPASATQKKP